VISDELFAKLGFWEIDFQICENVISFLDNYFSELGKHISFSGKPNAGLRKKTKAYFANLC
jgi:hypothetical protein